jgi:hypothetical protein
MASQEGLFSLELVYIIMLLVSRIIIDLESYLISALNTYMYGLFFYTFFK